MSIIEFIRDRARYYNCPVCGRNLKECEIRMLSHVEDRYTVQVTCAACHVTFIVVLAIQGPGLEPVAEELEMEIELEGEEQLETAAAAGEFKEPIETDEVLDVHLFLKDFRGSFKDLLREPDHTRG